MVRAGSPPLCSEPSSSRVPPVPLRSQRSLPGHGRPRQARALGRAPARCSRLCLVSGIRTEQDFYVRLIDSMTKQVGAAGRPPSGGWQPSGRPREPNPPPRRGRSARRGRDGASASRGHGRSPAPGTRRAAGGQRGPAGPCLLLGCARKIQATLRPAQSGLRMVLSLN